MAERDMTMIQMAEKVKATNDAMDQLRDWSARGNRQGMLEAVATLLHIDFMTERDRRLVMGLIEEGLGSAGE